MHGPADGEIRANSPFFIEDEGRTVWFVRAWLALLVQRQFFYPFLYKLPLHIGGFQNLFVQRQKVDIQLHDAFRLVLGQAAVSLFDGFQNGTDVVGVQRSGEACGLIVERREEAASDGLCDELVAEADVGKGDKERTPCGSQLCGSIEVGTESKQAVVDIHERIYLNLFGKNKKCFVLLHGNIKKESNMKFIGIIPARYASTRFPAKPLAMLGGKPVIQRVYEQVAGVLDEAYVATDDERIEAAVRAFGGKVVMTSVNHKSGTDRCYEAFTKVGEGFGVVVNIQGDEPFIRPSQLDAIRACFDDENTQIATLVKPFTPEDGFAALENVNSPKVVIDKSMRALYFSRSIIPYRRNADKQTWLEGHTYYKHIGLYAYRAEVLKEITALPQSSLEVAESLEQLRWLENGYTVKVGISEVETIGIDTPEDLAKAERFLKQKEAVQA